MTGRPAVPPGRPLSELRPGRGRALVAGTASDAHVWNLVYLHLLLEEYGFVSTNLGPCLPDELLIEHCVRDRPDLVVLSSVNGHGYQDGLRLIRKLRAHPGLAALPVVIGGKLAVPNTAPIALPEPAARPALIAPAAPDAATTPAEPGAVAAGPAAHVAALLAAGFDAVFDEQSSPGVVFPGYLDAAFPRGVHAIS